MCDRTLFTLDKEPRTDQSAHTTEVLRGEPISFIGVTYRNMGEGLLTCNKDRCSTMFIAASFIIARSLKEPRCPSMEEWIQKM